jgi:glycosyltransferase involved in cell wall biosynthesis
MIGKMDIRCKSMKASELISIIMPFQNTEQYLPACIDSIIAQSYTDWELIAVNDHSSDHSFEVIADYAKRDSRIRVINSKGKNILSALQTGYEVCTGSIIGRMDSDDIMHPRKLELLALKLMASPVKSIVAGSVKYFTDDGEIGDGFFKYARWLNEIASSGTYWSEIYRECVIPSCCWVMKREQLDLVGAFDGKTYPEDYDFCFRLYKNGFTVVGLTDQVHLWRDRDDRASRTKEQYADNRFLALKAKYFRELDYDSAKSLIIWGAGRNGKDLAKQFTELGLHFQWISDNDKKIGKHIYEVEILPTKVLMADGDKQVIIAISNESEKQEIKKRLDSTGFELSQDYWFFL